jgi:hypothetical protein
MSEVRHPLLITLVHGTWGRRFLPRPQRQNRRSLWFEEGSLFLARLSGELGDIPHQITPLLWSGANSIFVRDRTAHVLADHLSAEHAEHPQATQLIIAHSHGGNIALRALHHLKSRNASPSSAESANPLVVTLATPFVEVHPANFGRRPNLVRVTFVCAILWLLNLSMLRLTDFSEPLLEKYSVVRFAFVFATFFYLVLIPWWGWWWIRRRATARQNRVRALNAVTQLGDPASTHRLLVVRAIDDEASLALAFGTTLNYLTTIGIVTVFLLFGLFLGVTSWIAEELFKAALLPLAAGWTVLSLLLFGMLVVSRSAHGRELAVSPMECQINTQSTPDAAGLSRIVTLVQHTYVKSLRHGIYDHEDCAKAISNWVRSELSALSMKWETGVVPRQGE